MISDAAALVLFAIRSSIKLGLQMRQAYVDSTKRRELVLPLPNFFSTPDIISAVNYFDGPGKVHLAQSPRLGELLQKSKTSGKDLEGDDLAEVLTCHKEFFNLDLAAKGKLGNADDGTTLNGPEFLALITVRQWQRGTDPNPSTLQRLAGTFIEIGIDYFQSTPGALSKDSRQGKAIAGFLDAMSGIHFSEAKLGEIPGRLFIAALDTISEHGELLTADPKVQELVKVTTQALSTDVARRLDQLADGNLVKAQRVGDWAELIFRSVLSSAGGLVLSDPERFLGVAQEGQAALVSQVGQAMLGLVLDNDDLQLDRLFSRQGLETITKSTLAVVGAHPEILLRSNNTGLQKLLSGIATELSQFDTLFTPDVLPELTRMILEKTGENLPLLWPDLAKNPQKHLLLTAATTTLAILTRKPAAGQKWALQFSTSDLLSLAEAVMDELAANPTWLLDAAGKVNDNLKAALEATLGVLRNRADPRLSTATAVEVLRAVLLKIGSRKEFLDAPPGGPTLAAAALDAILGSIFDPQLDARASWQVVRTETITALVRIGFAQLAKSKLGSDKVAAFAASTKQLLAALATGQPLDLVAFEADLEKALAA